MAKLIKFPLEMADGTKARNLDELKEHADIASIASYYKDGRLKRWLSCNYLAEKAEEVVVTNTNLIADMIDRISPVRPDKCPPVIEDSDKQLREIMFGGDK